MCVFSVSSALSLSLSKVFPLTLPKKNIPKNINFFAPKGNSFALKKGAKSEKKKTTTIRTLPPAARALFFSEKLPCTRRTETLPRVSKGCEKTSRTRIFYVSALFFSSGGVPPARAKIHRQTTLHFFLSFLRSTFFRFFFLREAKKKTIARILLKLPHANDKNALRLSIRTGEWILRVV